MLAKQGKELVPSSCFEAIELEATRVDRRALGGRGGRSAIAIARGGEEQGIQENIDPSR